MSAGHTGLIEGFVVRWLVCLVLFGFCFINIIIIIIIENKKNIHVNTLLYRAVWAVAFSSYIVHFQQQDICLVFIMTVL